MVQGFSGGDHAVRVLVLPTPKRERSAPDERALKGEFEIQHKLDENSPETASDGEEGCSEELL